MLRIEGFRQEQRNFRSSDLDELATTIDATRNRLASEYVVGAFADDRLVGIGGLTRQAGTKLDHRALLWGMYVTADARGQGIADAIVADLIEHAMRVGLRSIILTLMRDNEGAQRLYRRAGFAVYGIEPEAIRMADGTFADEMLMHRAVVARAR